MGCETADHWVIKKVQNGDCAAEQCLVVEKASQINVQLWADICVARQHGATVICLADFGQFESIAQNWGSPTLCRSLPCFASSVVATASH